MADKRPALGRGLSALIPEPPPGPREGPIDVDLDLLDPNPKQPRTELDEAKLDALAQSVRAHGVIQPIVARRKNGRYEIVAGERRWRAAQRAGLLRIPVLVRDVPDSKLLEIALVENLQREDLNPIEEAAAYRRLIEEHGLTQEEVAAIVGKDRSSVANYLRLLKLPAEVQAEVASGGLTMGHARALAGLPDEALQRRIARDVLARRLSVRETELLIQKLSEPRRRAAAPPDVHTRAAEQRLRLALGTRVRIVRRGQGGRIEIAFGSEDELQRLYEYLTRR
jgi:ParB family chromosome partitioning protein